MSVALPSDWPRRRKVVLERDRWLCVIRGPGCTRRATEVDHIVPRAAFVAGGDPHSFDNLRSVCSVCHAARGKPVALSVYRWRSRLSSRG